MRKTHWTGPMPLAIMALSIATPAAAQSAPAAKPYQVEWWRLFQKYQIAALEEE